MDGWTARKKIDIRMDVVAHGRTDPAITHLNHIYIYIYIHPRPILSNFNVSTSRDAVDDPFQRTPEGVRGGPSGSVGGRPSRARDIQFLLFSSLGLYDVVEEELTNTISKRIKLESPGCSGFKALSIFFKTRPTGTF